MARRAPARRQPRRGVAPIDDRLATLRPDQRKELQQLRRTIRATAPRAEQCIRHRLPAFRQGRLLVAMGATTGHGAFCLMSDTVLEAAR